MKRRDFLNLAIPAVGVVAIGAFCCGGAGIGGIGYGFLTSRRSDNDQLAKVRRKAAQASADRERLKKRQEAMAKDLYAKATSPFIQKQPSELNDLPPLAQSSITQWFNGKCLRVSGFVEEILGSSFVTRFKSLPDDDTKAQFLLAAFYGRCCSVNEIDNVVKREEKRIGAELDNRWKSFCASLAKDWSLVVDKYPSLGDRGDLVTRVESSTKKSIRDSLKLAAAQIDSRTTIAESIDSIGTTAMGLIEKTHVRLQFASDPLQRKFAVEFVGNPYALVFAVPMFFLDAFKQLSIWLASWMNNPGPELQKAISSEVARLGNRVADEACNNFKDRIRALHLWQNEAILAACRAEADRLT